MPIRINEAIYGLRMPSDYERQQIGAYLVKYARAYNPAIYGIGIFFAVIGLVLVIRGASSLLKAEYAGSLFAAGAGIVFIVLSLFIIRGRGSSNKEIEAYVNMNYSVTYCTAVSQAEMPGNAPMSYKASVKVCTEGGQTLADWYEIDRKTYSSNSVGQKMLFVLFENGHGMVLTDNMINN